MKIRLNKTVEHSNCDFIIHMDCLRFKIYNFYLLKLIVLDIKSKKSITYYLVTTGCINGTVKEVSM